MAPRIIEIQDRFDDCPYYRCLLTNDEAIAELREMAEDKGLKVVDYKLDTVQSVIRFIEQL